MFITRLCVERKDRGWSQSEVARRSGINATTISGIETGRVVPYPGQIKKLAKLFNISVEEAELLGDQVNLEY